MQQVMEQNRDSDLTITGTAASWIWPSGPELPNQYIEFRQDFELTQPDPHAELLICAESNYALWLNDVFVDCGQYPSHPDHRAYDRLAVGRYLRPGTNTLLVRGYHQGADSFQYIKSEPGLIFVLQSGADLVVSGRHTLYRRSSGYREGPIARATRQQGFTYEYNAAGAATEWHAIADADLRSAAHNDFFTRPVAKLVIGPRLPVTIRAQGALRRNPVASVTPETPEPTVAKLVQSDFLSARHPRDIFTPSSSLALPSADGVDFSPALLEGGGAYVVIDCGGEEAGLLEIEIDADAGACIDIAHGEHLDDLRVRAFVGGRNFASRYRAAEGRQTFTHYFTRIACRYIQLHITQAERFKLYYVGLRPTEYPVQVRGRFTAADSLFDQVYQTGIRTLSLCMHERYEDSPWREQALYGFDGRNQALSGHHCFGDYAFAASSLALLGHALGDDGYLPMCAPAVIEITIPSFSFAWVLALDDYFLYSADAGSVRRMLPTLHRMLRTHIAKLEQDLLPCPTGQQYWQFYEWVPGLDGQGRLLNDARRYDAPLNLLFCLAIEAGARLGDACQDNASAQTYREVAARIRQRIAAAFWDSAENAYQTSIGEGAVPHFAELTQSLALLASVPPADIASRLRGRLAQDANGLVAATLSHCLLKFEAMLMDSQAHGPRVFDAIRRDWGHMLSSGATSFWETIKGGDDFDFAGSLCHGWSAIPVYIESAYLLGVRPLEPGFRRFVVDPVAGVVACCKGTVPTPHGDINVEWEQGASGFVLRHLSYPPQTQPVLGRACCISVESRDGASAPRGLENKGKCNAN